jgi:hypothetical protein
VVLGVVSSAVVVAQNPTGSAASFYPDDANYDPAIPTLVSIVGHDHAERVTSHHEMEDYLHALAESSPKAELVRYGETWEGRALYYLVIASPRNHARMDDIRAGIRRLGDPRTLGDAEAAALIADLPVIVWLSHSVHGNEISSTDAALLIAYQLVAARDGFAQRILDDVVTIIDPLQNPDGRDRFINAYRQAKARWPDPNTDSAELSEPWPGGRVNHYLFDLNRDWFAQTQIESRARVEAFLDWRPQVFADLHEMGSNGSYYFPPQAIPRNPNQQLSIMDRIEIIGRNNARWFDRMGFDYFNREVYDSFYPGYGASWPMYQGAMGMTYEQASVRGLARERADDTTFYFRDSVHHHFIASLSTLEASADNREDFLRHFYDFHAEAIAQGGTDEIREILIEAGDDPNRSAKLVSLLMSQGVEVDRAETAFSNDSAGDYHGRDRGDRAFPAGTYRISMAQPRKHLIKSLMAPDVPMEEAFVAEQLRRYALRQGDQIYDITGWSLPLIFDVDAAVAGRPSSGEFVHLDEAPGMVGRGDISNRGPAQVAYLIPWGTQSAGRALAMLHRGGIRVHSAGQPFTIGGREYPSGSLIVKVHDNTTESTTFDAASATRTGAGLLDALRQIEARTGADIFATDTSWVEDGINFGSGNVNYLPKPMIAMVYGSPASSYSTGTTRYLLEQVYEYPVTVIPGNRLVGADLSRFNVLILPDGGYAGVFGERGARRIAEWVQGGGTLVAINGAVEWLAEESVGLLGTVRKRKHNDDAIAVEPHDVQMVFLPESENPAAVPGAILRVKLNAEHFMGFGYPGFANVLVGTNNFFEPLTLNEGTNVGVYLAADDVVVSGFVWDPERQLLAGTPFLMHTSRGQGNVVAFTEEVNFRAYLDGLNVLFLNAVLQGPGY